MTLIAAAIDWGSVVSQAIAGLVGVVVGVVGLIVSYLSRKQDRAQVADERRLMALQRLFDKRSATYEEALTYAHREFELAGARLWWPDIPGRSNEERTRVIESYARIRARIDPHASPAFLQAFEESARAIEGLRQKAVAAEIEPDEAKREIVQTQARKAVAEARSKLDELRVLLYDELAPVGRSSGANGG
jgi:hypothetical protein